MSAKIKRIIFITVSSVICITAIYTALALNFFVNDKYTLIDGGSLDGSLPYFISSDKSLYTQAGTGGKLKDGRIVNNNLTQDVTLRLFNIIPVKTVSVNIVKSPSVIPSGQCIGVKIYSNGLVTVGLTDFETENGEIVSPAKEAGLKPGDIIKTLNGRKIENISDFLKTVDTVKNECTLGIIRNESSIDINIRPQKCSDGHMRIGVWVRDSIAGIGTVTFLEKETQKYAALGHGISDTDTNVIIPVKNGEIFCASVLGISKGKKGAPGEIMGAINEKKIMGSCNCNLQTGIYGNIQNIPDNEAEVEIAPRSDVKKGEASVICTLDDYGPKEYKLEIVSINRFKSHGTKSMIIKVTDPELLRKTGGIVQGMSGSPIIQNGRLIGAVTHVFVNDPEKGYAIFAETMLEDLNK